MRTLHSSYTPSFLDRTLAPLARLWQGFQDRVAKLVGLKNANTASAVIGVVGLTTMAVASILGPLGPTAYGAGLWTAGIGGVGLAENYVTKKVANWDGKGK